MSGIVMPAEAPNSAVPRTLSVMRTRSVAIVPAVVSTPRIRPPSIRKPVTAVCPWNSTPAASAMRPSLAGGRDRVDEAVGWDVERAQDPVAVQQRQLRDRLGGGEDLRRQIPGLRVPDAPLQLLEPLGRRGDLEAADRIPDRLRLALVQRSVELDGVLKSFETVRDPLTPTRAPARGTSSRRFRRAGPGRRRRCPSSPGASARTPCSCRRCPRRR